jgi:hypothetical protein
MLAVGFFYYNRDIFVFLPQPYAPAWHQCERIAACQSIVACTS